MGTAVEPTAGRLAARGLRCRHLTDPLGIEPGSAVFAWVPEAEGAAPQLAYRVLVASDPELLARGEADCWDSGRVESDRVNGVAYEGAPLRPRGRYWWTVQLWAGEDGEAGDGETAWFELGLGPEDWRASWIGGASGVSSPLLRAELEIPGHVRRARAYVSARGYCELRLNGEKVGDRVLDPPQTSYEHDPELVDGEGALARISNPRTLYTSYDLTAELREGANVVGLVLGHGWYSAEQDNGPGPLPRKPWGERPSALLQLEVETEAGEVLLLSDGEWRTAPGPVLYNDYAQGERHDARLEPAGWDAPGFDAESWESATVLEGPGSAPSAQMLEPVRVIETLVPVEESRSGSGARIVDFGQHISGWTRITVSGPAGAEITLRHTGELLEDGELDDNANMGAWLPARQTDTYVLAGGGEESWEPRFTLHGFRFVEVSAPDGVEVERVEGRVVHSDLRAIGEFSCSDPLLEQIHRNVRWTHRASFQGFPQDAAERNERVGWVGDPGWAIEDYLYNYDCLAFWLKWLDDLADAQLADGRFPVICPIMWRGGIDMAPPDDYEVPDDLDTMVYWPYGAWPDFSSTSYPSIAWQLYRYSGDQAILAAHYEGMKRGLEYLCSIAEHRIVAIGLGDHQEPQPDGTSEVFAQRTPVELTSTAWFYEIARIVAAAAEALERDEDARTYGELTDQIRVAFNDRFFDPEGATYATGSQTSLALPLWFGIVPEDDRDRVLATLVRRIREVDDGHLETGTMGTAALQQVLGEAGAADAMYGIATQTTYPSWGDQIERGATTVWETWGGDPDFSRNMKLMASVEKFLFRDVAGLTPAAPGWARIRVRPRLTHLLSHAAARVETPRGVAAVGWRSENGRLRLRIEVPSTSTAEVWLPGTTPQNAGERRELGGGVHEFDVKSGGDDE
jgi:alpha-L-rhamnosidase